MTLMEKEVKQIRTKLDGWNAEIDVIEQKVARRHQSKEMYGKRIDDLNLKMFNGNLKLQKIQNRFQHH